MRLMYFAVLAAWIAGCGASSANSNRANHAVTTRPARVRSDGRAPPVPPAIEARLREHYPFELQMLGVEGSVVVRFQLSATGEVMEARVLSATNPAFGGACIEALRAAGPWTPAAGQDGAPTATSVRYTCEFTIGWGANHT